MAAERTVYVKVGAKVDGAVAGLRKVKASVDDLTKADLKKPQAAFDGLSNKAALVGGVVALGIGKAVASFAEFDAAMSAVSANSGAVGEELEALRGQAVELGKTTQFSATEAAQGINELAKAGVTSQEILNGGLQGALDLAAAGQIGVAQAAETTASALNQFEQDGSQATHVADLLANAANAAQGGVGDMGAALGQAGVAAHAAGLDIDETTTLLALFAKAGLIGSDAGTSLKTMMQRLSAPTEKAAGVMEELGIAAYDAQGNFVGAESLIAQLSDSTKNLSTEAKMAAFNTIFGADAIRAASIAASAGADGYRAMATEVTKVGGAQETAAKLTDNLKGDIERLGGSIETAFITGGSSANEALRTLTQGLGGLVDVVSKVPGPILLATAGLASLALTLPKGISVYKDFTGSLDTMGISMTKLSTKAPRLAGALRGLQGVVAGLAIAATVGAITNAFTDLAAVEFDPQSIKDGVVTLDDFNQRMAETADLGGPIATTLTDFGQVLEATFNPGKGQEIDSFFATLNSNLGFENTSDVEVARKRFEDLDRALSGLVAAGNGDAAAKLFEQITVAAAAQGVSVEDLKAKLPGYADALANAGDEAAIAGPKMGDMSEDVEAVEKKADDAKKALDDLRTTLEGFGSPLAAQRAAQRDYKDAIDAAKDALKDQRDEIAKGKLGGRDRDRIISDRLKDRGIKDPNKSQKAAAEKFADAQIAAANKFADAQIKAGAALDQNTDAGRKNQATLDAIRDKALGAATATFDLTKSSKLAADEVARGRADFVRLATDLGLSSVQANALADNMGLIPKDVETTIGLSGVDTANAQLDKTTGKVTTLDKKTAKPKVAAVVDGVSLDRAEARINQVARQRNAFISISAGLTSAASSLIGTVGGIGALALGRRASGGPGGPVYGPGTGTSDTAGIYALSNNEHVLTAAEVAAAGGHGAIFALRKAILSGGVQFRAQGGPATSAYRPAPVVASRSGGFPSADAIAAAMAAQMPPSVSVYSGEDARSAARTAIRDWEWSRSQ